MKKCDVVKKNKDFDKIIKEGKSIKNKAFVIYYMNNSLEKNRFGISVGKKIGNAVTRNYYKRVIRNICDKSKKYYSNGKDYIIIMRKGSQNLSFSEILENFLYLLKKINEKEGRNE